jgi:cation-transporting ATPase E
LDVQSTATNLQGLTEAEAQRRRSEGLGNSAPLPSTRTYAQILGENLFTFINLVLFGLGVALVLLHHPTDALISVGVIAINVLVSIVQEIRAKRILDRVALLTRPRARVIRDGQAREVAPEELVVGDLLHVRPGDQIVLDGSVVGGEGRQTPPDVLMDVDESLLTGESNPIPKRPGDEVYSGSFCVAGSARYVAEKVGAASLAHQLTAGARAFRRVQTPLQRQINMIIRAMLLVVLYIELLLVINSVLNRTDLVESVQQSVIIAGLVPNGLLLSIALAYAIGAVRILRFGALVQEANAIESLSCVDVLCLDKTGTLTANRLLLDDIYPLRGSEAELRRVLGVMVASATSANKTSAAIAAACPAQAQRLVGEVAFSSARQWSALAFDDFDDQVTGAAGDGGRGAVATCAPADLGDKPAAIGQVRADGLPLRGIYALGAPDALAPHLDSGGAISEPDGLAEQATERIRAWTERGLRVLLLAHFPDPAKLIESGAGTRLPEGMRPLGLVSLRDELRPEAGETLAAFIQSGVQPKIISGDDPRTVAALARQAGFGDQNPKGEELRLMTGPQIDTLSDAELEAAASATSIFGRVTPQQKERLVEALRRRGHYVAMIGDGVNDVLSLKKAQVGIAMQSGSQATRGVADIVLMNDSFAALAPAVREGQRILNGMQAILKLFLTRIATIALVIMSAWLIGIFPLELRNGSLVTLLTVGIPSILLALWAQPGPDGREGLMRNLLRFVAPAAMLTSLMGLLLFYGRLTLPIVERTSSRPHLPSGELEQLVAANVPAGQTMLTAFLVTCGVLLILFVAPPTPWWAVVNRVAGDRRPALLALGLLSLFVFILLVHPLGTFFTLAPLSPAEQGVIALVGLLWVLLLRMIWRTRAMSRLLGVDLS